MDTKNLEKIRFTAIKHVQRCTPTCPLSTSCRFRHGRGKLRYGEPCTQEVLQFKRFVLEVTHDSDGAAPTCAFDLMQAAMDAALLDLLVDRCARRLADWRALIEEANEAEQPGPEGRRSRQSVARTDFRPEVGVLMRLMRRKNKLIDRCRALCQAATDASSPDGSYAEFTQALWEYGGQDIHDAYKEANPDLPDDWCLPGQSRFIRPKPQPENGDEKGDS